MWAQVARSVSPLRGRALPEADPEPHTTDRPAPAQAARPMAARVRPPAGPPPLAPIERKTRLALRRGRLRTDAVLDLHGLRQGEAHDALLAFLRRSQAAGHSIVVVVTGKGSPSPEGALFEERGVLKRLVPHWLRLPDLRPLVLGFEEAAPHQGGGGALYVRLRRRKGFGA